MSEIISEIFIYGGLLYLVVAGTFAIRKESQKTKGQTSSINSLKEIELLLFAIALFLAAIALKI